MRDTLEGPHGEAIPTRLYVYVDETEVTLSGGRRLLGAGALIVPEPIAHDLIDRAMHALRSDPDRVPTSSNFDVQVEKFDKRTCDRGHFHASVDSKNAHSHLARDIKAIVRGWFECSFAEATSRADEMQFRMHSIGSILPAVAARTPLTITFEQRSGFGSISAAFAIDYMNRGQDWSAYETAMMPAFYPRIEARVRPKAEPGLQVVDLLLWSASQSMFAPESRKARIIGWCGAFRWAQVGEQGAPHQLAKYFVNQDRPVALALGQDFNPYPVTFEDLDQVDEKTMAGLYCMAERIVRQCAEGPLPEHAEHLRAGLRGVVKLLHDHERVGPEQIGEVARHFLRLFDTVPIYDGLAEADPRWLSLVRAKRLVGLTLRQDKDHGRKTANFFATMRRMNVQTNPTVFGLK